MHTPPPPSPHTVSRQGGSSFNRLLPASQNPKPWQRPPHAEMMSRLVQAQICYALSALDLKQIKGHRWVWRWKGVSFKILIRASPAHCSSRVSPFKQNTASQIHESQLLAFSLSKYYPYRGVLLPCPVAILGRHNQGQDRQSLTVLTRKRSSGIPSRSLTPKTFSQ